MEFLILSICTLNYPLYSVTGALCTYVVSEAYYMDNLSGFCYTTENKTFPGIGVFLFCLPPLISCAIILVMLVVLLYQ